MPHKREKAPQKAQAKFEIVLKADSVGSLEAVTSAILHITVPGVEVSIIRSGVGAVSKSDVLLAETGSRFIAGFQVGATPELERVLKEHHVEVRLYDVIYTLTSDMKTIAEGLLPPVAQERIVGSGKVIALFKSGRKDIIIGCEVLEGFLALGEHFRIISAMGPVYSGALESLHIGASAVQKATQGRKVGIKIRDFKNAKIGDLVESYRLLSQEKIRAWEPKGQIIRKYS